MPDVRYITTEESLIASRESILNAPVLGCDTETANYRGDGKDAFDPLLHEIRLLQISPTPEQCFIYDLKALDARRSEFDFLRDKFADNETCKVFHNAKFDLRFLELHFDLPQAESIYDTYLASVLINGGDTKVRDSLADCVKRYCDTRIDKTEQSSNFSRELTDDQIRYSAIDAMILHPLRASMNSVLEKADLRRVANLEFDAVQSVARIENAGFFLDGEQWLRRCEVDEKEKARLAEALLAGLDSVVGKNLFGEADINLDSHEEITEALKKLGVELPDSTRAYKIKPLVSKWPILQTLIDYREAAQAMKTFGPDYIKFIHEIDGRIHTELRQIGTPTGRFTSNNPNTQQVPADVEYRSCFKAQRPETTLIVADYSMIELRLLAEFSRDPKLCEAFQNNVDLHSFTASFVFNKTMEECGKGSKLRRLGKDLNFGTVYDISAARFAMNTGQSEQKAQEQLDAFFNLYSTLDTYLKDAAQKAIDEREARTFSGRTHKLPYDENNKKEQGLVGRNGRNTPIQGSCSDIFKRALYLTDREFRQRHSKRAFPPRIVNPVHDEIVAECETEIAEEVRDCLTSNMIAAGQEVMQVVPCAVDAEITKFWAKG